MSDKNSLESFPEDEEIFVSLPIRKQELGNFISGLLGQQQSIERDIAINFDIDHEWIVNLHELIDQRITRQTNAKLTSFTAAIYFEDGLKRTHTSIEAFKNYQETKKSIPVGIKIIWNYIIQFPDKRFPEKQQITFSAQIFTDERIEHKNTIYSFLIGGVFNQAELSTLNYQIDHTERTWGDDLESIISSQVNEVTRGNQLKDTWFNTARIILAILIVIGFIVLPIYAVTEDSIDTGSNALAGYLSLDAIDSNSIDFVIKKLDYIAQYQFSGLSKRVPFLFLSIYAGFPIAWLFLKFTRISTHSFLVVSKYAEIDRKFKLKKENRRLWILLASLIGSFGLSVLSGIVGNYGFKWLGN